MRDSAAAPVAAIIIAAATTGRDALTRSRVSAIGSKTPAPATRTRLPALNAVKEWLIESARGPAAARIIVHVSGVPSTTATGTLTATHATATPYKSQPNAGRFKSVSAARKTNAANTSCQKNTNGAQGESGRSLPARVRTFAMTRTTKRPRALTG